MLELPESHVIARQIDEKLRGKTIVAVETGRVPHSWAFFLPDETMYRSVLPGETIKSACGRGGMVEVTTDRFVLFFGDGASPRWYEAGNLPQKHQLLIRFADGDGVAISIRMYGFMGAYPLGQCDYKYYLSARDRLNPFSPDFTYAYFRGLCTGGQKRMSLKAFLATEQRIPGLGNGVLQDILWHAGLDPRLDVQSVSQAEWEALYQSVMQTLSRMRDSGGRSCERDLFGAAGGYQAVLSKDTLGLPCPRCGEPIRKAAYMGGTVYFCEGCQRR